MLRDRIAHSNQLMHLKSAMNQKLVALDLWCCYFSRDMVFELVRVNIYLLVPLIPIGYFIARPVVFCITPCPPQSGFDITRPSQIGCSSSSSPFLFYVATTPGSSSSWGGDESKKRALAPKKLLLPRCQTMPGPKQIWTPLALSFPNLCSTFSELQYSPRTNSLGRLTIQITGVVKYLASSQEFDGSWEKCISVAKVATLQHLLCFEYGNLGLTLLDFC